MYTMAQIMSAVALTMSSIYPHACFQDSKSHQCKPEREVGIMWTKMVLDPRVHQNRHVAGASLAESISDSRQT